MVDYNQLAQDYARYRQVHPTLLQSLLEGRLLYDESRVLEVGCGTGNYIIALEQRVHCQCRGIDPSEQMLARAKERGSAVTLSVAQAEALDEPDAFFDLVFSVGTTSIFPYISAPVLDAYHFRKPSVEINPGQTDVTEFVTVKLSLGAAAALDAIWSMYRG